MLPSLRVGRPELPRSAPDTGDSVLLTEYVDAPFFRVGHEEIVFLKYVQAPAGSGLQSFYCPLGIFGRYRVSERRLESIPGRPVRLAGCRRRQSVPGRQVARLAPGPGPTREAGRHREGPRPRQTPYPAV